MADVYKIAVSIALANGVSPVLAIISTHLLGLNTKIQDIEKSFGRWATAAGGVALILGGEGMLGAMVKMVEHGRELVHQQELMKIAGMDNKEIAESIAKSYDVSGRLGTLSLSEGLQRVREIRGAFGDTESALKYLEFVSKLQLITDSMTGKKGGGDQIWELVKSGEMKGLTQKPEEFESLLTGMTKAIIMSGGKVTAQDFFSAFKYGRTAMYGWDENFITQFLPSLIMEMKSGRAGSGGGGLGGPGNALMSMYQYLVSGQMPKVSAEALQGLGLLQDKDFQPMEGTALGKVSPYGVTGTKEFMQNPYQWVQDVLVPAIKAKYGDDQEKMIAAISQIFRLRTAGAIAVLEAIQGRAAAGENSRMEKDARLQRLTMPGGLDATIAELKARDPFTVMESFHKQWISLLEAFGSPMVEPAMNFMRSITGVITSMTQFAGAHPEAIKIAAEGIAAVSAAILVLGGAAVVAAISPLIGAGGLIFGLAAALGVLAAVNFDAIRNGINAVTSAIASIASAVGGFFGGGSKSGEPTFPPGSGSSGGRRLPDVLDNLLGASPTGFHGATPSPGLLHSANWSPPQQPNVTVNVPVRLDIDGRTLADVMSSELASVHGYPTQAPMSDGTQAWNQPDFASKFS